MRPVNPAVLKMARWGRLPKTNASPAVRDWRCKIQANASPGGSERALDAEDPVGAVGLHCAEVALLAFLHTRRRLHPHIGIVGDVAGLHEQLEPGVETVTQRAVESRGVPREAAVGAALRPIVEPDEVGTAAQLPEAPA